MAKNVLASDLMVTNMQTIRADQSLTTALRALVELQAVEGVPNALAVVDADGMYQGLLTSRLLTRSLLALWMPEESVRSDEVQLNQSLLQVAGERLQQRIGDTLIRGIPTVSSTARLLVVIAAGFEKRLEFIPVVDGGRIEGLIPVTALFQAIAGLVLTPEHEGIRFDQQS